LARQPLLENALGGTLGSLAGLSVTIALVALLPSLLPAGFPRADAIAVDARVLTFTLLLSVITTIACGVLPLLHVRRLEIARALGDSSAASAGAGRSRLAVVRALIVSSQVAVTCVLVIGGVLLARSFTAQITADRGYEPESLLTAGIPFPQSFTVERKEQALTRILERVRARPGISHAAMSTGLPLASAGGFAVFQFPSPLRGGAEVDVETYRRVVTPGYFEALGIRLRAGRVLSDADSATAPRAVVVNRTFVAKYLENIPIEQAIGLSLGTNAVRAATGKVEAAIVGVVDDTKQERPDEPPQSEIYVSFAQLPGINHGQQAYLVARTTGDPLGYVAALRTALREEDPTIALDAVMTMDQRVGTSLSRPRLYAVLFLGFAVFALVIAGAGLFGVLSQSVSQRSRELAVRTALGASRAAVIGTVLRQVAVATAVGLVIGLAGSAALSNNLAPFIYGVSTTDWLCFGVAPAALLLGGAIACVMPARRVAQTDPVTVLRES
ncbi:MAG: FtsX-like permease family protein, partial [Acidimicrobiia bacterium]